MISEKQFASSHSTFWHELLPMAEEYLRTRNRTLTEFASPIFSALSTETRGFVNELGFRLYVASLEQKILIPALPEAIVTACVRESARYIGSLRERPSANTNVAPEEIHEAKEIASKLALFFPRFARGRLIASPVFRGCGWLDECSGDLLGSNVLFEVKAGDRTFRGLDIRQVLIYCALNFASKTYDIANVCLVNPRLGVYLGEPLQRLCLELSGKAASEVMGEIVQYISDPIDRYAVV